MIHNKLGCIQSSVKTIPTGGNYYSQTASLSYTGGRPIRDSYLWSATTEKPSSLKFPR